MLSLMISIVAVVTVVRFVRLWVFVETENKEEREICRGTQSVFGLKSKVKKKIRNDCLHLAYFLMYCTFHSNGWSVDKFVDKDE